MNKNIEKYKAAAAAVSEPGELVLERFKNTNYLGDEPQFGVNSTASPMKELDALESMPQYWIPGRAPDGPRAFEAGRIREKLKKADANLDLAFNRSTSLYAVFEKAPISLWWCRGWRFLFDLEPRELNNQVLAAVYMADTSRRGGARAGYEQVVGQMERDKQAVEDDASAETRDWASEYWNHLRPSVGYGRVTGGNKVVSD